MANFDGDIGLRRMEVRIGLNHTANESADINGFQRQFFPEQFAVVEGVGDELVHAGGGEINSAEKIDLPGAQTGAGIRCRIFA